MPVSVRVTPSSTRSVLNLLRTFQHRHGACCPCHSNPSYHAQNVSTIQSAIRYSQQNVNSPIQTDYAFEMASSTVRYGPGCTSEIGMDLKVLGSQRVCLVTDKNVSRLGAMRRATEALSAQGITFTVFEDIGVEPTDTSVKRAIKFSRKFKPDAFVAVGGGSVLDTAKMMNLYTCYPTADFLHFVPTPLGLGLPIEKKLLPLIAVPTTAGTGSETTGTAIFDLQAQKCKSGIAHRALKPTLGICDPLNIRTMPAAVRASSGLDVLCHSLESWTAIPYHERAPRPANPTLRPTYQGANPISDIFSLHALRDTVKYLPRAVRDPEDIEAQDNMFLASTLAGIGFGNAGVHLCHGMSYPISSQNPGYHQDGYVTDKRLIPHGVSVAVTAPSVFKFTAASNPERHLEAAAAFGVDTSNVKKESAGEVLSEALADFLSRLGGQPSGIKALGFQKKDIDALVDGTLPQRRVLGIAPNLSKNLDLEREQLTKLFEDSLEH